MCSRIHEDAQQTRVVAPMMEPRKKVTTVKSLHPFVIVVWLLLQLDLSIALPTRQIAISSHNRTTSGQSTIANVTEKAITTRVVLPDQLKTNESGHKDSVDFHLDNENLEEGLLTELDREEIANVTLVIDYNQQTYELPTSAPPEYTNSSTLKEESGSTVTTEIEIPAPAKPLSLTSVEDQVEPVASSGVGYVEESRNNQVGSGRSAGLRDQRDARLADKVLINATNIFQVLLKKKPYSKFWSAEQKWDDIFKRFLEVEVPVKNLLMRNFLRDIEYYVDIGISEKCAADLKFVQDYTKKSTNVRWLFHMFDSLGKDEPGMLTGNLANLGHVVQCIRVRAPTMPSNHTFEDRFFEQQTELLGERFRGKYCLASLRPVMPEKPRLVSRFSSIIDEYHLSNISFTGEPMDTLKQRAGDTSVPRSAYKLIDKKHLRLDQIPFESELYQFMINQRNFMYSLPRFMGVCYPSSCTKEDVRASIQKTIDDQHLVADIEFQCEQEEYSAWDWYSTPRLMAYVMLMLVAGISFIASLTRYILVDKLGLKDRPEKSSPTIQNIIGILEIISMDKAAGILFVKTKPASMVIDEEKLENNRSTSIDALKGLLILGLIYSELVYLGSLPVPFMWSKWGDAMFPFYRSFITQIILNTSIWTESFYIISAFLIALKFLLTYRERLIGDRYQSPKRQPDFASFALKRYIRLVIPVIAFIGLNYIWPRLSSGGFVLQDQAGKLMAPCDSQGWTNLLLFHNHGSLNDTCLWPSHVSATFFQLHLLSYPILVMLLNSMRNHADTSQFCKPMHLLAKHGALLLLLLLMAIGIVYPALVAADQDLIVPFLIDYLDFDNYRRVLEWTVMPTYNHLTSYMVGIALAYLVVKRKASQDDQLNAQQARPMNCGESIDSFKTISSTKALDSAAPGPSDLSKDSNKAMNSHDFKRPPNACQELSSWMRNLMFNLLASLVLLLSITASWYWNGLGQPMSQNQTFWYMCATKLLFNLSFGYLFYEHFATRRNSFRPGMLTRFLVPIGRVALTLFYVSWLVIWFDLLSSLYQWHPSHYFVCEKYNEIIFMALVVALFTYGASEGPFRAARYRQKRMQRMRAATKEETNATSLPVPSVNRRQSGFKLLSWQANDLSSFEGLFVPLAQDKELEDDKCASPGTRNNGHAKRRESGSSDKSGLSSQVQHGSLADQQPICVDPSGSGRSKSDSESSSSRVIVDPKNLSISDQYKLNAELRANYSFASIGLYESAGAIGDLGQSNEPQVSN